MVERCYADCRIIMLNVIMLSVVMLSAVSPVPLNVVEPFFSNEMEVFRAGYFLIDRHDSGNK
jgi:hypothetical protein